MSYREYYPKTFFDTYRHKRDKTTYAYENINEGLITTYNIFQCEKHLVKNFPEIFDVKSLKFDRNTNTLLYKKNNQKRYNKNEFFEIKLYDIENLKEIEKLVYNLYGWFITRMTVYYRDSKRNREKDFDYINGSFENEYEDKDGNYKILTLQKFLKGEECEEVNYYSLLFEAKFTTQTNNFKELYHLTDFDNLSKIKKYGLIPKTKLNYNERVYFSPNLEDIAEMIADKFTYPILLKLNFEDYDNEIRKKYKFFEDPRMDMSVFTYDTISPKYIKIYKNNCWENII